MARGTPPDLILLDIQLRQRWDGYSVAQALRGLPSLDGVPIIAVTSYAMVGDREKCFDAGCNGYLEKPINPETFVSEIESPSIAPRRSSRGDRAMRHILVVDDKEENVYFLQALLRRPWLRSVETAHHGAEALVKARHTPPDVIISDLLMPVMDGYTLLRHWKADARLRLSPFIVYTATYTEPEDEKLALSLGADAFILKPLGAG